MDTSDQATFYEEQTRTLALAAQHARPVIDYVSTICTGCSYLERDGVSGKDCDGWADCLVDFQRRNRGA